MVPLACDGLKELEGLLLTQRLQGHLRERQVASQVGELGGKPRLWLQPLTAYRAQQQHTRAMALPVACQVAHQVEGGSIHPVQVIQQQHQRRALCQGVQQARHRFKQLELCRQLIFGGGGQIGVAHP